MSNLKRKDKIYTSKNMTGREGEIITNNDYCLFKIIDRVYKYLHELYKVQTDILPRTHCQATRGHTLKLEKRPAHHRLCQSFFTQRVADLWNSLPSIIVNAPSVNVSKNRLYHHWKT